MRHDSVDLTRLPVSCPAGSTPTPSSTPLPRAYGTVRELAVLDCNGGLHILPGHPLETNFNLRGVKNAFNIFASETSDHARCAAGKAGCTLTDAEVERHFIPSVPMILNYYEKPFNKLTLPSGCMRTDVQNGQTPAFGQTFWDQSAWSTVLLPFFLNKSTTLPEYINWPDTCNLATYAAGLGCKITVDEPVSGTIFQVGVDRCPRSFLPYISITCRGKWCENFMRPCEINTNAPQCGDGLVCRTTEDDTGRNGENPGDQLLLNLTEWGFLGNLASEVNMLLSTPQEPTCPGLNSPGGGTVRQQMYLRLRNQLMSWWNVSIPPTFNLRPSPDLAFCLPPDATQKAIQNQWDAVWDTGFDVDLSQDADVVSCLNGALDSSCDLEKIGDGQCDVGCYIAACKWDGGDCGGPPLDQTLPVTFNPDRRATNFSDSCLVQPLTSTDPLYDFRTRINYWEPCNGAPSRCEGVGNQFTCQCWCNLNANDRFIPADLPGSQCQNCKPPPLCEDRAACAAKYKARGLLGFTNRIDSWDGILDSGLSVFDWDRKTGLNYSTPMGFFDISRGVNPGSRPLLQTTCSGEVAITLVNGWLQAGAHMPLMQEAVSFVTGVNRDLQVCRNHFIQVARGTPPQNVVPLSQQQMDVRFMPHTLAHWMYQYMTLGQNENAWNQNTMWQYVDANGPGGAGAGAQQKITNAFWFGIFEMNDTLVVKEGNRREPSPTPTPSQGAPAATAFLLSNLPYADEWRMLPPRQGSCDIQSALDYRDQNNEADASRRCNFKWNALGFLFPRSDTDWNLPSFHELWIDIQHDSCQNAPTGRQPPVFFSPPPGVAATPLPMPTMDRLMAKRAMPQVNVWYAGDAVPWMSSPKACVLDSDCGSYGGNARCADLDLDFLNISDYFGINSRNVDPFGFLPFGRYNANQGSGGCSGGPASVTGQSAFRRSMRNVLLALAGRPPTALGAPKFCMMFPRKYKLDYGIWEDTAAFRPNTCGLGPLAATPSPSIRATATSSPLGSPTPAYKCVLQSALPTAPSHVPNYRPVQMLNVDRYDDSLAVGFDMLGVSPLRLPVSSARTLSTSYGSQGVIMPDSGGDYVISLPGWRAAQITNKHADRFRYALATAYTRFGVPIPPDSIFIMRVGEYAAGISVFFRVDLPDRAWRGNLTDQMFSGRPGTLSQPGIPGSVMAEMGVAPTFRQGEVVFAGMCPAFHACCAQPRSHPSTLLPPTCRDLPSPSRPHRRRDLRYHPPRHRHPGASLCRHHDLRPEEAAFPLHGHASERQGCAHVPAGLLCLSYPWGSGRQEGRKSGALGQEEPGRHRGECSGWEDQGRHQGHCCYESSAAAASSCSCSSNRCLLGLCVGTCNHCRGRGCCKE